MHNRSSRIYSGSRVLDVSVHDGGELRSERVPVRQTRRRIQHAIIFALRLQEMRRRSLHVHVQPVSSGGVSGRDERRVGASRVRKSFSRKTRPFRLLVPKRRRVG
jgi:hypothetical protein